MFKHAVKNIAEIMDTALEATGVSPNDIDWFVPHQANKRILDGTARRFGMTEDKVVITLDKHGNTSAASIPLALDVAYSDGRLEAERPDFAGGHGWRVHLGLRFGALVSPVKPPFV